MKVLEAVGVARAAPCRVVCAAPLSLMYSSMHSLGRAVNRVERTLLNFFMRRDVRGGFFRAPRRCFAGDFGVAARREWAVLLRNSGVFGLSKGATRRFGARRTLPGRLGEKIFKNLLERGENPKNGVREVPEGAPRAPYIGCARTIFESGGWAPCSVARGALRADALDTSTHHETSLRDIRDSLLLYRGLYMEYLPASSIAHSVEASLLVRPAILQPSPVA